MYPKRVMRSGYVLSAPAATRKCHPSGVRNNRGYLPLSLAAGWSGSVSAWVKNPVSPNVGRLVTPTGIRRPHWVRFSKLLLCPRLPF